MNWLISSKSNDVICFQFCHPPINYLFLFFLLKSSYKLTYHYFIYFVFLSHEFGLFSQGSTQHQQQQNNAAMDLINSVIGSDEEGRSRQRILTFAAQR